MMRRFVLAAIGAAIVLAPAGIATAGAGAASSRPAAVKAVQWPVVRQGARGERVRAIQLLLEQHGARLVADGAFGKSTTTAVKAFQRAKRLVVDGHVGPASWEKLVVTLRRGARGDAVRALQVQLKRQLGDKSVTVDGEFGKATETAVKNFQGKHRLRVDGVVGVATWKAIEAA
jgi:peptidoglycan hydrolase-like protein with peptidoglycan-binding domain